MTVYLPQGVRAKGMGALFFAPAVADMAAPKLTEFTGAGTFAAHCDLYAWSWNKNQSTITEDRYCLSEAIQAFGDATNEINPLEVLYDPQEPDSPNYQAYLNLKEGTSWFVFDRRGLPARSALVADAYGDVLHLEVGQVSRAEVSGTEGEKFRSTIPLIHIDPPRLDVQITT